MNYDNRLNQLQYSEPTQNAHSSMGKDSNQNRDDLDKGTLSRVTFGRGISTNNMGAIRENEFIDRQVNKL